MSSGLGAYFGVDPVLVRVGFVVTAFLTSGTTVLVYLLLALLMPVKGDTARNKMHTSDDPRPQSSNDETAEPTTADPGKSGDQNTASATRPQQYARPTRWQRSSPSDSQNLGIRRRQLAGWIVIGVGALILAYNLGAFEWISFGIFFSAALILGGVLILVGAFRRSNK